MVGDNDDTTDLSDAALMRRLKRLRGEDAPEPEPKPKRERSAFDGIDLGIAPPYELPDLHEHGLIAMDHEMSRSERHDAIEHRLTCKVIHDDMAEEIQKSMRFDLRLHLPGMFQHTSAVVCERYDAGTRTAVFRPIEELPPVPKLVPMPEPTEPVLLIIGRSDRAEEFARVRNVAWKSVRTSRDLRGHAPGTKLIVLDEGYPHSPEELEKLLALAADRGYEAEMVTFGRTSPSEF
jgi:hypothetical protein